MKTKEEIEAQIEKSRDEQKHLIALLQEKEERTGRVDKKSRAHAADIGTFIIALMWVIDA